MPLKEDSLAPDFVLEDKSGKKISLSSQKGDYTIVYFYPKDNTPGCTIEAKEFTENLLEFHRLNTEVIGISGQDARSKKKFIDKNKLKLILLSDPDFSVSKKYKAYGEKSFLGKKFMGINRMTYVIDKDRKIIKVFDKVKPIGHANEVLRFVKDLKSK